MSGQGPDGKRRLAEGDGPLARLLSAAAVDGAEVPRGARERVWAALHAGPTASRRPLLLAGLAAAAAAAAALLLVRPSPAPALEPVASVLALSGAVEIALAGGGRLAGPAPLALPEGARLEVGGGSGALLSIGGAQVALAPHTQALVGRDGAALRLSLQSGAAALRSLPAAPGVRTALTVVAAGAVLVQAEGAGAFVVTASAERVLVHAFDGAALVRSGGAVTPVASGSAWSSSGSAPAASTAEQALVRRLDAPQAAPPPAAPPSPPAAATPLPPPAAVTPLPPATSNGAARPSRLIARAAADARSQGDEALHARAHQLESEGRFAEAEPLYQELAGRGGARAEAALYELGRLRLRFLHQPATALSALDEHQRRFPAGALALESSLTAIEARLALGQGEPALREMDRFLSRYGESERAAEVRWLRAELLQGRGDCGGALPNLRALAQGGARAEESVYLLAGCARAAGDAPEEKAWLEEYLRRFPGGRRRAEVEAALRGGGR